MKDPDGDKDTAPFTEPVLPGMEGVEESTAMADDETVVDPEAPDAPAPAGEQEADADPAQPDAEIATLTKNYKSVQAWATKVSQENAAMRRELEALRGGQASAQPEADPEPVQDTYDWNEFNRIADEKGREAAFEHRDAYVEKRILARIEARERAQSRQGRVESEAVRLAKLAEIKDTDFEVLEQLRQGETSLGFEPSPGALMALRLGGGSWDKVIAALKGRGASPAAAPAPRKVHPGLPGGHGERAPAKSASRNAGKLSARQAGF